MPSARTPAAPGSWSRSLRDSDDDDDSPDDHLAPTASSSPARAKRTSTPTDEGSDWAWGADTVDIGLVSEPQGLKFVETPFTLAKRTGASKQSATSNLPTAPKGTSSQYKTPRSTPARPDAPRKPPSSVSLPTPKVDKPTPTGPATARGAKTAAPSPTSSRVNRPTTFSRAPLHLPDARPLSSSPLTALEPRREVVSRDAHEKAPSTTATSDSQQLPSFTSSVPAPSTPSTTPLLAKAAPAPGPTSSSPLAIRADSPSPRSPSPSSSPPAFQAPLLRPTAVRPVPSVRSLAPGAPSVARAAAAAPPPTPSTSTRPHALDGRPTRISTPPPRKKQRVPLPALAHPALAAVALDLPGPAHASPPSGAPPRRSGAGAAAGTASSGAAQARLERFRHVGNFAAAPSAGAGAGAGTGVGASTGAGAGAREVSTGGAGGREGGAGASAAGREEPRTTSRPSGADSRPTTALHTSTFHLPGLVPSSSSPSSRQHAPSSPTDRLAFKPAESLAEFRARRAAEVEAAARGRGTGAGGRGEEAGGGGGGGGPALRERIVLGTAVRSVRPVALAQAPSGSGSSARGRGRGRARGGFAAPRAGGAGAGAGHGRGDEPSSAASRSEGESAEARLRRVYRSLDG